MTTTNRSKTTTISNKEKLNWLRLARSENIGKSTFFRLIEIFGTASKALENVEDFARQGGLSRKIRVCSPFEAEAELNNSQEFGAEILLLPDPRYPRLLRHIPDPAPILTVKGDIEFFERDIIAIVGPRNASFNGIAFAKKIALELGQNSIIIASGMARGVDTAAHEASILSGTIAVIAGGINHIYPQENKKLYEMICKSGLIMTENPYNFSPKGGHFVQRNRLISGIALGVVVVEAGLKSGSLTTAKFAIDQGREVFAMPGSPFDPRCHGTNRLIKDGAKMLETIDDILEEIAALKARFGEAFLREPEVEGFKAPPQKMPSDSEIKKARQKIFPKLSFEPTSIDDIILTTELPPRLVSIALVQLELADKIEVSLGKATLKPPLFED